MDSTRCDAASKMRDRPRRARGGSSRRSRSRRSGTRRNGAAGELYVRAGVRYRPRAPTRPTPRRKVRTAAPTRPGSSGPRAQPPQSRAISATPRPYGLSDPRLTHQQHEPALSGPHFCRWGELCELAARPQTGLGQERSRFLRAVERWTPAPAPRSPSGSTHAGRQMGTSHRSSRIRHEVGAQDRPPCARSHSCRAMSTGVPK